MANEVTTTEDFTGVLVKPEFKTEVKRFEPPAWTTSTQFRDVLAGAYQCFLLNGRVNPEVIATLVKQPKMVVDRLLVDPEFQAAMEYRGINYKGETFLTAEMDAALLILTDPHDRRTIGQKLRAAKITNAKYQGFLRNPTFKRMIDAHTERLLANNHEALMVVAQKVSEGDLNAAKFQLEVNKRYNPRAEAAMGQQEFLANIVEIITKRITNPETLMGIMEDFRALTERIDGNSMQIIEGNDLNA